MGQEGGVCPHECKLGAEFRATNPNLRSTTLDVRLASHWKLRHWTPRPARLQAKTSYDMMTLKATQSLQNEKRRFQTSAEHLGILPLHSAQRHNSNSRLLLTPLAQTLELKRWKPNKSAELGGAQDRVLGCASFSREFISDKIDGHACRTPKLQAFQILKP